MERKSSLSDTTNDAHEDNAASPRTHRPANSDGSRRSAQGADVAESLASMASSFDGLRRSVTELTKEHARERPYALLGVAAGIGFVLGGGLASRLTGVLLTVGGRIVASQLLNAETATALASRVQQSFIDRNN